MKKLYALFLALVLIFSLIACNDTNDKNKTEASETDVVFVYVAAVTENGFVGSVNDLGRVFVEYSDNDTLIELFDTVYVKYNKENLEERQGTFTHITGSEDTYKYVIKDPITVRQSDPSKGEPLYG